MPARDLLVVLLRVVGLYFVVLNASQIPTHLISGFESLSFSSYFSGDGPPPELVNAAVILGALKPVFLFILGIILVLTAPRIALRCHPAADPPEEATLSLGKATILGAGLRVLGVLLLIWAVEPLISSAQVAIQTGPNESVVDAIATSPVETSTSWSFGEPASTSRRPFDTACWTSLSSAGSRMSVGFHVSPSSLSSAWSVARLLHVLASVS